jgi:tetratricopeptide (TPR) repeat protein
MKIAPSFKLHIGCAAALLVFAAGGCGVFASPWPFMAGDRVKAPQQPAAGRQPTASMPPTNNDLICADQISLARSALARAPSDAVSNLTLARVLAACRLYPEAIVHFKQYLEAAPNDAAVLYDEGLALLHAGHATQAAVVFRKMLALRPNDAGGLLGLAQSLADAGEYPEALRRYHQVLRLQPKNPEALRGVRNVEYWNRNWNAAEAACQTLNALGAATAEDLAACHRIIKSRQDAAWASTRPPSNAPAAERLAFYQERLRTHRDDALALTGAAAAEQELGNNSGAIAAYRRLLSINPQDEDAQTRLAQLLTQGHQFDAALSVEKSMLKESPSSLEPLRLMEQTDRAANRLPAALVAEQTLLRRTPSDVNAMIEVARIKTSLGIYGDAMAAWKAVLAKDPANLAGLLGEAELEMEQKQYAAAARQLRRVITLSPRNAQARMDLARIEYYGGHTHRAYQLASSLVDDNPKDFDAVMLLAHIERAGGNHRQARRLAQQAERLSPGNAEVTALEGELDRDQQITLHTSAAYAREVSVVPLPTVTIANEDLNSISAGTTLAFNLFPRSESSLSVSYMPVQSPATILRGAAAPAEFMYHQSTQILPWLEVRGGAGMVRLGPGELLNVQGLPPFAPTTSLTPVAYAGFTLTLSPKLSAGWSISRDAIGYTPLAARFGVMQRQEEADVTYQFDSRTRLRMDYFKDRNTASYFFSFSPVTYQFEGYRPSGVEKGSGGNLDLTRRMIESDLIDLDLGYSGLATGFDGPHRGVFLGYFDPNFYQRHFITWNASGPVTSRISYSFAGGAGLQQLSRGAAFTGASQLNPSLGLQVNPRLTLHAGFIHYSFAQAVGLLSGNAVELSSDWTF